jgi:hypothetical protein
MYTVDGISLALFFQLNTQQITYLRAFLNISNASTMKSLKKTMQIVRLGYRGKGVIQPQMTM